MSPTKPQGILLTPGTATARRKTVSFGAGVLDNEDKNEIGKSGIPNDCPGKFPSPWTPKYGEGSQLLRQTHLTKTLQAVREEKTKHATSTKGRGQGLTQSSSDREVQSSTTSKVPKCDLQHAMEQTTAREAQSFMADDFDGDMTLDLNEPRSQSGRYWKSEFEKYHDEAVDQMKKLVKYKQLAKSYAKKKDDEAIDLRGKLEEEQQKVVEMERKISQLAAKFANKGVNGADDGPPDLVKRLTHQTALTVQYKNQVDQFRLALDERDAQLDQQSNDGAGKKASQRTARTLTETSQELKRAREQLREMASLRDEVQNMRRDLSAAERRASKLQDENAKLSKDLAKVSNDLEKSERRRQSAEAQNWKQDELVQTLQKDYNTLKELAKSQRRDAERLLKKRHDQVSTLKKEIMFLRDKANAPLLEDVEPIVPTESRKFDKNENDGIVKIVKRKSSTTKEEDLMSFDTPQEPATRCRSSRSAADPPHLSNAIPNSEGEARPARLTQNPQTDLRQMPRREGHLFDIKIPIQDRFLANPKSGRVSDISNSSEDAVQRDRPAHRTLSEIINNADVNNSPAKTGPGVSTQLTPSLNDRFLGLSLQSPVPALPATKPSLTQPRAQGSYDQEPSPTKQRMEKARPSHMENHDQGASSMPSSRVSSMTSCKVRTKLPPERAAAALARLEQKSAEKKKSRERSDQKENIRV